MKIQIDGGYYGTQLVRALERRTKLLNASPEDIGPDWLDQIRSAETTIASIVDAVWRQQEDKS